MCYLFIGKFIIGRSFLDRHNNYADMEFDELLIFEEKLSASQVTELYNSYWYIKCSGLISHVFFQVQTCKLYKAKLNKVFWTEMKRSLFYFKIEIFKISFDTAKSGKK